MAEDEESQVAEDFGRMVRIAAGSIMQVAESRARRRQVGASTDVAASRDRQRMEANAARVVQHDLYRAEFWKHAGSESIADRMAVAATLGESNPAAQSAWMHGADVIRATYGIDLQKINREHPSSQEERHAALRDALDDRLQMRVMDQRADQERARANGPEAAGPTTFPIYAMSHERDTTEQLSKGQALDLLGRANGDELLAEANDPRSTGAHVKKWVGRDADVDRAIAAHVPEWVPQADREAGQDRPQAVEAVTARHASKAERLEAEADRERMEEGESLERAERAEDAGKGVQPTLDTDGLAARREFARERAEEASAAPEGLAAARVAAANERAAGTGRVNLGQLEQTSPQMVQARVRQLQSFAMDPKKALAATKQHGRRGVHNRAAEQGRQEVISR
ncbi:hypothetical protein [Micrococcus luteus]|uniref:hypothetical protein n=1 Tax=Micrococcus luteus TaxID=1270 RepID=UPI00301B3204